MDAPLLSLLRPRPEPKAGRSRTSGWTAALLSGALIFNPVSQAQASICGRDAMLVFDASSSMAMPKTGPDPARIDDARRAMVSVLPEIASMRRIGLMVYGAATSGCDGIRLRFRPRADAAPAVSAALEGLEPEGLTPLTASVEAAAEALNYRETPAIIVLVTDGTETCDGRPCALGRELASLGAHTTVHVVGFRRTRDPLATHGPEVSHEAQDTLRCLAESTGGVYVDTQSVADLSAALRQTLGCMLVG